MLNNTVCQFLGSNLGVEIFLKKKEHQKKGALYTLYWGFKKIPFTLYTYVLYKKFVQKLTLCFKNHMRNLDNFRQAVESPKN